MVMHLQRWLQRADRLVEAAEEQAGHVVRGRIGGEVAPVDGLEDVAGPQPRGLEFAPGRR